MASGEAEARLPVPEYESKQYLPTENITAARRRVLVEKFGPVRTYFKLRSKPHLGLQRRLNQSRLGTTYDIYLTETVLYATIVGIVSAILGVGLTAFLSQLGVLEGLEAPFTLTEASLYYDVVLFIAANRVFFFGAIATLLLMAVGVTLTWIIRYYYPYLLVDNRRRNIDVMLPHSIVYMYALSFGGMDFTEVLKRMAAADETYGEVAKEFDMIVRDVEIFGNDMFTAIRNARNLTASENLEMFLDDLLSVLDSGGDMAEFLHDESEKYMRQSQEEQKQFLQTLAVLSEVFIVAFVAAPIFLLVTLIMMSLLGAAGFSMLFAIIYLVIPLGMAGFIVVVSMLSEPYKPPAHHVVSTRETDHRRLPIDRLDEEYNFVRRIRIRERVDQIRSAPFAVFKRTPELTGLISVPLVLVYLGFLLAVGGAPTTEQFTNQPFLTTVVFFIIPFFAVVMPITIAHEIDRKQKQQVAGRLPDALDILTSSNQMGVRLVDGLGIIARNVSGQFSVELQRVQNDIRWNYDIGQALLAMADRMKVPQLTRTCKILAEGTRSTGELHRVIKIAAQDTRHRLQMERAREQELNAYVVVVVIGFLVYLGTLLVLDRSFLTPIGQQAAAMDVDGLDDLITIGSGTVSTYHMLFLHSAVIQGIGTGLIIGELVDNDMRTGLKYSIALVLLALLVFFIA